MRVYGIRSWWLLSAVLLAFFVVNCDVEYLDSEGSSDYRASGRGIMSSASPTEVNQALEIIANGGPLTEIPWAYSIILEHLGVIVDSDDISLVKFTVGQVAGRFNKAGLQIAPQIPSPEFVAEVLKRAITEFNSLDAEDITPPEDVALVALASSLTSRGITDSDQIKAGTVLKHGDVLILLVSIHQSPNADQREANALAGIIHDILEENGADIENSLPDLVTFIMDAISTEVSVPHQGEVIVG